MRIVTLPKNRQITIYEEVDTAETIREKVALAYNVDPRFVSKFDTKTFDPPPRILTDLIHTASDRGTDFTDFYETHKDEFKVDLEKFAALWKQDIEQPLQQVRDSAANIPANIPANMPTNPNMPNNFPPTLFADVRSMTFAQIVQGPRFPYHPSGNLLRTITVILPNEDRKIVKIYDGDLVGIKTDPTHYQRIMEKIASVLGLGHKFINRPTLHWKPEMTVHITPIGDYMRENSFAEFRDFVIETSENYIYLQPQDYVNLWLAHTNILADREAKLFLMRRSFAGLGIGEPNIYVNDIDPTVKEQLEEKLAQLDDAARLIDNVDDRGIVSEFDLKKQGLTVHIANPNKYPLDHIFDLLELTLDVPFATYDKYCKTYSNFVLNGDIHTPPFCPTLVDEETESPIVLYYHRDERSFDVSQQILHSQRALWIAYYSTARICLVVDDKGNDKIELKMDLHIHADVKRVLDKINALADIFVFDDTQTTTRDFSGDVYLPNQNIDGFLIKDILLFHPVFSRKLYINDNTPFNSDTPPVIEDVNPTYPPVVIHYIDQETKKDIDQETKKDIDQETKKDIGQETKKDIGQETNKEKKEKKEKKETNKKKEYVVRMRTQKYTRADNSNETISKMLDNKSMHIQIGDPLTVVRFNNAPDMSVIEAFRKMLAKVVHVYNRHQEDLTAFYSEYVQGINQRRFATVSEELENVRPDVFIPMYTRKCSKQRKPQFISEAEYNPDNDPDTEMEFPKGSKMYLKCGDNAGYGYMGVIENNLENKDAYPVLPCCFKTKQTKQNKPNSLYSKYLKQLDDAAADDEIEDTKTISKNRWIQLQKFADPGQFGRLPENVEKLFEIFGKPPVERFSRCGVHSANSKPPVERFSHRGVHSANSKPPEERFSRRGVHSANSKLAPSTLIECILIGIGRKAYRDLNDDNARLEYLKNEREEIAKFLEKQPRATHLQECFDIPDSELCRQLRNMSIYLSPYVFIRIVEECYGITLFPFVRNAAHTGGDFLIPRHSDAFAYLFPVRKEKNPIVIVIEHGGGIYDQGKACELIVSHDDIVTTKFDKDEAVLRLFNVYTHSSSVYYNDHVVTRPIAPMDVDEIDLQYIDMYGKTRAVRYGPNTKFRFCEPTAPLDKAYTRNHPADDDIELDVDSKQPVVDRTARFTNRVLVRSALSDQYVQARRKSKHLIEYASYLLSKYVNDKGETLVSRSVLDFANEHIKVDENADYTFEFVLANNPSTITVESELVKKKLMYMLRVHILNNYKTVSEYFKSPFMHNYYNSPLDFKSGSTCKVYLLDYYMRHRHNYAMQLFTSPPTLAELKPTFYLRYNEKNYLCTHKRKLEDIEGSHFFVIPFVDDRFQKPVKLSLSSPSPDADDEMYQLVVYVRRNDDKYYILLHQIV